MQGKFPTIGTDSPIGQLAGVIRGSVSQGNSRNGSASSTSLNTPQGTP